MNFRKQSLLFILCSLFLLPRTSILLADEQATVKLPLAEYDRLIASSQETKKEPRPAPASYALGRASLIGVVSEDEENPALTIKMSLEFDVLEDQWTSVPLLPAGSSVVSATIDGVGTRLTSTPQGLFWNTDKAGHYTLNAEFKIGVRKNESGFSASVPTPQAASISFNGNLPKNSSEIAVIPSTGTQVQDTQGNYVLVESTIPSSSGFQITWKSPLTRGYSISRAEYRGVLKKKEESIAWSGLLSLELSGKESVSVGLLPQSSTLSDIKVDDKPAPIYVEGGEFKTQVKGAGTHNIRIDFQTAILKDAAAPQVQLNIPSIPISHIELLMPERKELSVTPFSNISYEERKDGVVASLFVPMSNSLSLSWTEAVPEEIKEELRANARYVHTIYAEEGVLYGVAHASYEITRGKSSVFELEIPKGIQINRIHSDALAVADWRLLPGENNLPDRAQVFLEHEVSGNFEFEVEYDQSINGEQGKDTITVPILRGYNVHRQQGMLALLSGKEVGLKPVEEEGLTKVGENLLPTGMRELSEKPISHTYKYGDTPPVLKVQTAKPERREGKFDAVVNALLSLSDVTMSGTANIEVNIKTGSINELQLELPTNINVLGLTAPSLRVQKTQVEGDKQIVDVQFTQEMEGQFRIELSFEKILSENDSDISTPNILVKGAEIQQGKLAVQAISAVEVQASSIEQLSTIDPSELPQQLLLKTTNPILLAYSYVRSDPPYRLGLKMTRHKELDVQAAAIDTAEYKTLFTADGLAITTARFMLRNSRQQFLRVDLPPGAQVWSAAVDNVVEKPALAHEDKDPKVSGPQVLLKIVTSSHAFPVELVYQSPIPKFGALGTLRSSLPRPDMVVTNSTWSVYLPEELSYGQADSNMKILAQGVYLPNQDLAQEVAPALKPGRGNPADAFRISVPTSGIRFTFAKLYANQSNEDAYVSIPYRSNQGKWAIEGIILLGLALAFLGMGRMSRGRALASIALVSGVGTTLLLRGGFYFPSDIRFLGIAVAILGVACLARRLRPLHQTEVLE